MAGRARPLRLAGVAGGVALAAGPPFPQPVPGVVVYDEAGIFSDATEAEATRIIEAIEARTGAEIVVYTQVRPGASDEQAAADAQALGNCMGRRTSRIRRRPGHPLRHGGRRPAWRRPTRTRQRLQGRLPRGGREPGRLRRGHAARAARGQSGPRAPERSRGSRRSGHEPGHLEARGSAHHQRGPRADRRTRLAPGTGWPPGLALVPLRSRPGLHRRPLGAHAGAAIWPLAGRRHAAHGRSIDGAAADLGDGRPRGPRRDRVPARARHPDHEGRDHRRRGRGEHRCPRRPGPPQGARAAGSWPPGRHPRGDH